jgi:uracil-DNA glycosylase family 4
MIPLNGENHKPKWCLGCPLYDAAGPVFGPPPKSANILFLGEAPGKDEVELERRRLEGKFDKNPNFQGGAGRVLYKWCSQVGINRDGEEVRNVVKCRPTVVNNTGREVDRAPTEEEIRHCAIYLSKELETVRPNLIVALGNTALYVTTGQTAIKRCRGRIFEGPILRPQTESEAERRIKVLTVYHPAYVMRSQEEWPLAVWDLSKAKKEAGFKEIRRINVSYNTTGSLPTSQADFISAARRAGFVVFDLEAEGIVKTKGKGLDLSTGTITVMGLSTAPYTGNALHWTPDTQSLFSSLIADPHIEKVGQNSEGFDIPYCERRVGQFKGRSFDTLQALHLVHPEQEKNLDNIASLYTDMEPWKGKGMYQSGFEALKLGNCKDLDATCRAYLEMKSELKGYGMEDLYYNGVMSVQPVLRAMSDRGLKQDEEKALRWSVNATIAARNMEKRIKDAISDQTINLDSPKQLSHLLYDVMGLPVQYKKDKRRGLVPTVGEGALNALSLQTKNPIFHLILQRRKINTFNSTFCQNETDDKRFVHYKIASAKAATEEGKNEFGREKGSAARNGRLISFQPNFQNQPLEARELYLPDTAEHILIEADWSQIEWRAAMVLSGEPFGLSLLASGADNHTIVAAECFNITPDEVLRLDTKFSGGHGSPRFETKFIVYGLGYGRGAADIAKQLSRDISWVEQFINRFKTRLPVYWKWRGSLESFVGKNSYLANPFGRRRWWYTRQVTEMYNFPPSSTAADMMYRVLPTLERQLPQHANLRLTVHDSVLVCAAKDVAKTAVECLRDVMHTKWEQIVNASDRPEVVRKHYPGGWYCPSDIHLGTNWRECKKGNRQLEKELNIHV